MQVSHVLRHWFVPHQSNNHRSKVLHLDALFGYVLLFSVMNFGVKGIHTAMPDVLGYATDINIQQLLSTTNAERTAAGLNALSLNAQLSEAAARKAQDMFTKGYWAHNSPTGSTPWDFISGSGYKYVVAGENLAKNFSNSHAVVSAWKASPTHWANIIKPSYKEIGFAVVNGKLNGEETTLVVQMFGTSTSDVAVNSNSNKAPVLVEKALATEEPAITSAPVSVLSEEQSASSSVVAGSTKPFESVLSKPLINIPTLSRDIVFVFAGVLMGVLLLDAWIVSKKKIVRIAGHNIAHFLFLSAIVILAGSIGRGALL
jgi:hypothetical protein